MNITKCKSILNAQNNKITGVKIQACKIELNYLVITIYKLGGEIRVIMFYDPCIDQEDGKKNTNFIFGK